MIRRVMGAPCYRTTLPSVLHLHVECEPELEWGSEMNEPVLSVSTYVTATATVPGRSRERLSVCVCVCGCERVCVCACVRVETA